MIANLYIESDVELAGAKLERFITGMPLHMANAFAPRDWRNLARKTAEETLMVIATPAQQPYVPLFVRTVMVEDEGLGMDWSMAAPSTANGLDVKAVAELASAGQLFAWAHQSTTEQLVRTVAQWVATEKNKDARDAQRDDAQITARILRVIRSGTVQSPVPGTLGGGAVVQSNAGGLLRHLQDFADRTAGALGTETVNSWMEAVLMAWAGMVAELLPTRLRVEIQRGWR